LRRIKRGGGRTRIDDAQGARPAAAYHRAIATRTGEQAMKHFASPTHAFPGDAPGAHDGRAARAAGRGLDALRRCNPAWFALMGALLYWLWW
jgi:hypothetical protein